MHKKLFRWIATAVSCCGLVAAGPQISIAQDEPIAIAKPTTGEKKSETLKAKSVADGKMRPLTISAQLLRTDMVITGALVESTTIVLKTAFGEASIPLAEVAGVRFPAGQDTSTTVVMLNGDSITGASDVKSVTVDTEWGTAKINGENVLSMMFVPGLEWQSINGLNGARWTLTEAKAKPNLPTLNPPGGSISGGSAVINNPGSSSGNILPGGSSPANSTPRVVFPR